MEQLTAREQYRIAYRAQRQMEQRPSINNIRETVEGLLNFGVERSFISDAEFSLRMRAYSFQTARAHKSLIAKNAIVPLFIRNFYRLAGKLPGNIGRESVYETLAPEMCPECGIRPAGENGYPCEICFYNSEPEEVEPEQEEYDADCPYCLRGISHSDIEHNAALTRVYRSSRGDW